MRLCHVLPRHSRRLVRNLKGGINSDCQGYSPLTPTAKIAISLESKNYTTFCPHAFRAYDDSMCHVYPVEDCVKGLQGNLFKLPYSHVT